MTPPQHPCKQITADAFFTDVLRKCVTLLHSLSPMQVSPVGFSMQRALDQEQLIHRLMVHGIG